MNIKVINSQVVSASGLLVLTIGMKMVHKDQGFQIIVEDISEKRVYWIDSEQRRTISLPIETVITNFECCETSEETQVRILGSKIPNFEAMNINQQLVAMYTLGFEHNPRQIEIITSN